MAFQRWSATVTEPASPTVKGPPAMKLTAGDELAAFGAAGFKKCGGSWRNCDDTGSHIPSSGGDASEVADLNGDGLSDAAVTQGGSFCYGRTGQDFWLVSMLPSGKWRLMTNAIGIPEFLQTKGQDGWPESASAVLGSAFRSAAGTAGSIRFSAESTTGRPCKPPR